MNWKRKFGEDWRVCFRELAYRRLRAWGFNTIANWSAQDVQTESPIPFTVWASHGGRRNVEGSGGFWGKMVDVFDPSFAEGTDENIARTAKTFADNPLVVGWFVDNEMSWEGIPGGALASPPDQPARVAFVEDLKGKYGSLEGVNEAWGTKAGSWDELRMPQRPSAACHEDLEAFEYRFARRYFEVVAAALDKHAPNHLYLGCRFSLRYCPEPALRACAEVVDVVSINGYLPEIEPDAFVDLGKPVIIGEFHFGALDRGMFHQGLQAAEDQADRGRKYAQYVRSVARNPAFVGCHWFEYADQPTTGRSQDGENYAIGLVSVVDVPYEEFIEAAREVHGEVYEVRAGP